MFQGLETEFGWIPLSKKEPTSSRHPSPRMEVMTGVEVVEVEGMTGAEEEVEVEGEEITWSPLNSASPVKTDFQRLILRAPLIEEEEEEDIRGQLVMKMMTKNCESAIFTNIFFMQH